MSETIEGRRCCYCDEQRQLVRCKCNTCIMWPQTVCDCILLDNPDAWICETCFDNNRGPYALGVQIVK